MALPNLRSTIENGLETSEETDLEQEDRVLMLPQQRRQILRPLLFALCGLLLNGVLMTVMGTVGLPFYLETTGTILTAFLGGYVPAIAVALLTNLLTAFVDPYAIYYGALHILIALVAGYVFKKEWFGRANVLFWLVTVGISGGLGGLLTWFFQGLTTNPFTQDMVLNLRGFGWSPFWSWYLSNLVVSCIDKAVTILIVDLMLSLIPKKVWSRFQLVSWRQEPMEESGEEASAWKTLGSWSLNTKLFSMLVAFSITIATICITICLILFREYSIQQHAYLAEGVAKMVADTVDADSVELYLSSPEVPESYRKTARILSDIRDSVPDVVYVYVYKIMTDGCHVVFDVDEDEYMPEVAASVRGDVIPFDASFMVYIPDLLSGNRIDPIITNDTYGHLLTVYEPVYDKDGYCVCYACADVAMENLNSSTLSFLLRAILLFVGLLMFILAISTWFARFHLIMPIKAITRATADFDYDNVDSRERNVMELKRLDIRTDDEIERLYRALLRTTEESTEYYQENKERNEKIEAMQNSLILVLADMVENRDDSTGDHVRKTAAYVNLIVREMRELGYYKDKITDKFIQDCVSSAPLHDIGKIAVSDNILNKPARLTQEEYEIMKTHTTSGCAILDEVIATMPDAGYLNEARNIALYHHEKWDGSGYPEGLAGEAIPLSARIMAVADVFDALVSERCYKKAYSFVEAMDIIKEETGTHFDPLVTDAFLKVSSEVFEISETNAAWRA